ncbi:MAG: DUF11 domain-containing protein [Saprospiraceae bacterium]
MLAIVEVIIAAATGIWLIPTLGAGESVIFVLTGINPTGDYTNCAQVLSTDQADVDSTPGNAQTVNEDDNDCVVITPLALADLSIEKSADVSLATAGDTVTFTITLVNEGPNDATGVTVSEVIASGFSFESSTASMGSYDPANGIWTLGTVPDGVTATLVIRAVVNGGGDYCNEAFVISSNETDPDSTPGNGVDTDGDGSIQDDPEDEDDGDAVCIEVPCQVSIDIISQSGCNDAGTPVDPTDDFFVVVLNVTGVNVSAQWSGMIADRVVNGNYNDPQTFIVPISSAIAGNVFITIRDNVDNTCTNNVTLLAPESCSNDCLLFPQISTQPQCDDNGTPSDASDDVYYYWVTVAGQNTPSSNWTSIDNFVGTQTGAYNEAVRMGPYSNLEGQPFTVTFRDAGDPDCGVATLLVTPPDETCSDVCAISVNMLLGGPVCNDNDTPADGSDDVYYAYLNITSLNGSFYGWLTEDIGWDSGDGGSYHTNTTNAYRFGPYPSTENHTITIWDALDPECSVTIPLVSPGTCEEGCILTIDTFTPVCDNNGTPFDPTDDTYSFDIRVVPFGPTYLLLGGDLLN